MDYDLVYYKDLVKAKRQRDRNWDRNEKKALIRLVQRHRPTIDNKGNDNIWIHRKNAAWEAVQRAMAAEGFRRGIKSIRQQWARTKSEAKKKQKTTKKGRVELEVELETEVKVEANQISDEPKDLLPTSIASTNTSDCVIKEENLEPHEINLRFNASDESVIFEDGADDGEDSLDDHMMLVNSKLNYTPIQSAESSGIGSSTPSNSDCPTESLLLPPIPPQRKFLPEIPTNRNILHARLRQIEEETAQKIEIHSLEVTHRQEIHALKKQQLREQIEQQRQLFEAQMAKLKSSN